MQLKSSSKRELFTLALIALLHSACPAFGAQERTLPDLRPSPSSHPAAETLFVPSFDELPAVAPNEAWYEKTGAGKGLSGRAELDEELFAAPDVAVLDRGFAAAWPGLFAEFQEPVSRVQPREAAGLSATKTLLVIPSGALANTSGSTFFKAGLAEYVRTGGIIFCMTQQRGSDYSLLPAPPGQHLDAAGWSEDTGPLFRVSAIQTAHPLVMNMTGPVPGLETDGYFTAYPDGSQLLLKRPDGFPTALVYPFEKGWVVVTTLFTDFSTLLGSVEPDEKNLVRQLLIWARRHENNPAPPAAAAMAGPKIPAEPALKRENRKSIPSPRLRVKEQVERKGDQIRLALEIPALPGLAGRTVLARAGGQEKAIVLEKDKTAFTLDIPATANGRRISYALYETNGRALIRGSVLVPGKEEPNVAPDRPSYIPGDTVRVDVKGMGKGEITCGGLGYLDNEIIPDHGSMNLEMPVDLPAGSYRIEWSYEELQGRKRRGDFAVDLHGYTVEIDAAQVKPGAGKSGATASLEFRASSPVSGHLRLILRGPDGSSMVAAEPVLSLRRGVQTVPVAIPFAPDRSGIWELLFSFSTTLPSGSGIPEEPVQLAAGGIVFDSGDAAVLAITTDKPLYYEPSGPVEVTAAVFSGSRTMIDADLDGRQILHEKTDTAGTTHYRVALPKLEAGVHTIRVGANRARADHTFTYGLNLPDLDISLHSGDPRIEAGFPALPLMVQVKNLGKGRAGQSRIVVSEADGKQIGTIEVPALPPKEQHQAVITWPLLGKAGTRTLAAAISGENTAMESSRQNNLATATVTVPDILLISRTEKAAFNVDEPVAMNLAAFNLGTRPVTGLTLDLQVQNPAGRMIFTEKTAVPEVSPGAERSIVPRITLSAPVSIGAYRFSGRLIRDKTLASVSGSFSIKPTLLLTGSLEGTPADAVLCRPFTVRWQVANTGNAYPSSGTISFEIVPRTDGKPLFSKSVPFKPGAQDFVIDSLGLPPDAYTLRMTASVSNSQYQVTRDFTLAEQPLTVAGPVLVKRIRAVFPRVLVWLGRQGRVVEQAVAENIVKQAFEQEELYYKMVDTQDEFVAQARTGLFNTYVLLDPQEVPDTALLKERVQAGQGLVVIGSDQNSLAVAAQFGFSVEELSPKQEASMVTFTAMEKLGLSGTMPVSGKPVSPRKKGAKPAALYSPSGEAAALFDLSGNGRVLVMPLSLSRSALYGGAPALYSLVLRRSVLFTAPDNEEGGEAAGGELVISSYAGPVSARIVETLPRGERLLWANAGGTIRDNTVTYTVTAGREPSKLLYLGQRSAAANRRPSAEIFYECGGKFLSQGKVE